MYALSASDGVRCGLGPAKEAHLTRLNELGHSADGFLDRRVGINSMLIIEVDPFDLHPAQGCLASRTHIVGFSIDTDKRAIRPPNIAKLGGEHDLVAAILDGFSNQLL